MLAMVQAHNIRPKSLGSQTKDVGAMVLRSLELPIVKARPYPALDNPTKISNEAVERIDQTRFLISKTTRLASIERFNLHDFGNAPDLNEICSLAAAERAVLIV
ncbi:hypothetical protein PHYPSEUDO_003152 [Phytophthora pseudosyringae]|uniref:Uncharacterized protein n=1 Tax=Phytophthora pseudosyringae TaxID=221518 RepID=A0A8T1VVI3_9STRA|nr:hypothetical protein PHYPSEUDO_003152 [Phytophthora pseudosyringae]